MSGYEDIISDFPKCPRCTSDWYDYECWTLKNRANVELGCLNPDAFIRRTHFPKVNLFADDALQRVAFIVCTRCGYKATEEEIRCLIRIAENYLEKRIDV